MEQFTTQTMKRFLLFGGRAYYARGGFNDFLGSFNTKEDAKARVSSMSSCGWYHIFDSKNGYIVDADGEPHGLYCAPEGPAEATNSIISEKGS